MIRIDFHPNLDIIGIRNELGQQKSNNLYTKRKWQLDFEEHKSNDIVKLFNLESIIYQNQNPNKNLIMLIS